MTANTYGEIKQALETACASYQRDSSAKNWTNLLNKMTRAVDALNDLFIIARMCMKPPQPDYPEEVVNAVADFLEVTDEVGNFFLQGLPVNLAAPDDDEDDKGEAVE